MAITVLLADAAVGQPVSFTRVGITWLDASGDTYIEYLNLDLDAGDTVGTGNADLVSILTDLDAVSNAIMFKVTIEVITQYKIAGQKTTFGTIPQNHVAVLAELTFTRPNPDNAYRTLSASVVIPAPIEFNGSTNAATSIVKNQIFQGKQRIAYDATATTPEFTTANQLIAKLTSNLLLRYSGGDGKYYLVSSYKDVGSGEVSVPRIVGAG
jgi:hypothetical protein